MDQIHKCGDQGTVQTVEMQLFIQQAQKIQINPIKTKKRGYSVLNYKGIFQTESRLR